MSDLSYFLPYANLVWLQDETPYSPLYNDIYWGRGDGNGLDEKQHVFIQANELEQRWQELVPSDTFTVLETGFGFGLNLMLTIRLWRSLDACQNATLHYVAFEQHPVSPADLSRPGAFASKDILQTLLEKYPLPIPGEHHLWLDENICLTLIFGDINITIPALSASVDACYLDGFSPSKNKGMWSGQIFRELQRLMRPGATLSSYSVAGSVKRGLEKVGLNIHKLPGYGNKSEMLAATKPGCWSPATTRPGKVAIIGAGIAGLHCALALKRRGITYELYEASGNPLGAVAGMHQLAVYPQLSSMPQTSSLFSLRAFEYLRKHISYEQSGRLRLLTTSEDKKAALRLVRPFPASVAVYLSAEQATSLAGFSVAHDSLYLPAAGWVDPLEILSNAHVSMTLNCRISRIEQRDSGWRLYGQHGQQRQHGQRGQNPRPTEYEVAQVSAVIFATGSVTQKYLAPLNLTQVRGQSLKLSAVQPSSHTLISGRVTLFPEYRGASTVSGTYSRDEVNLDISSEDTAELIGSLNQFASVTYRKCKATAGIRTSARDRMPVVAKVPDWAHLERHCQLPERQRQSQEFTGYSTGLYCAVGFGSHGASHAPFCAEYLARLINNEPVTRLPELSTTRFAFRDAGIKIFR